MLEWLSRLEEARAWVQDPWLVDPAILSNDIETIQWVLANYDGEGEPMVLTRTLDEVAGSGALDVLHFILTKFPNAMLTTAAMDNAAENGHLHVVKYLHTQRSEGCTSHAMNRAAGKGQLDVVKWLHENRSEGCTTRAMDSAASNGYLDTVQFLHEHRQEGCTTQAMEGAASKGHFHVIRFLHEVLGKDFTSQAFLNGIESLELTQYFLKHGGYDRWSHSVMDKACGVSLEHALLFHGHPASLCSAHAMGYAVSHGDLDTVEFLHENRSEGCTVQAMDGAAKGGHFEVLQFLHEHR